jgi:hypothetical protein
MSQICNPLASIISLEIGGATPIRTDVKFVVPDIVIRDYTKMDRVLRRMGPRMVTIHSGWISMWKDILERSSRDFAISGHH